MTLVRNGSIFVGVALAAVVAVTVAQARTPAHQTFRPKTLSLTFQLPSEWGGRPGEGHESKFRAIAPGRVAELEVLAGPTSLNADDFATAFVNSERSVVLGGDMRAKFSQRELVVGEAIPATEIVATYRGFGDVNQLPGEKLAVVLYGFVHAGKAYILQFTTTDSWLPRLRGEFRYSARSVRFPYVA